MKYLLIAVVLAFAGCKGGEKGVATPENEIPDPNKDQLVVLTTKFGDMKIKFYDETPLHKDNFLKLAGEGFYDSLLFHRVIKDFMIQGGDPKSKGAPANTQLGSGGPGYTIPAEFNPNLIHKKGALAAARTGAGNPEKRSSGSQFYIVKGKTMTDTQIDQMEKRVGQASPGFKYTPEQRELYKTIGGTAFLDMNYTVYGEVIEGLNIIDSIAKVSTFRDRPNDDVMMSMKIIYE